MPFREDAVEATDHSRPDRSESGTTRPPGWRPLRVAMIGQKGVPATYGGIERHVEEMASRLAAFGHEVTVYCRDSYGDVSVEQHRGIRLRRARTVASKHLDAIVHSTTSTLAALAERPDIVHYHGLGPILTAPLARYASRSKVVLTVHGLDNQRDKWGRAARAVLGAAYRLSGYVPDARVTVSRGLSTHYATRFGRPARYIPNGVAAPRHLPPRQLDSLGLRPGGYLLLVGRLVPEKAADLLVRAFRRLPTDLRLVVVGGSAFTDEFVARLRREAGDDPRIVFTGFVYGEQLAELYSHAAAFVQPSRLEGLPLTLLEAASYGLPVVASDIEPHVEVLERDAPGRRLFRDGDGDDLLRALATVTADVPAERAGAALLRDRVLAEYNWDAAARDLERLYFELAVRSPRLRRHPGPRRG
ncbi:GDP-mannose-dependent alpha-(1-6)-phosphatidylinositol monomannoside mannosyltransferase [Micromonospora sp. MW-13]|uniref:glycosyltransferase family 4 protein n=1 Tax=unclassified Micromonospora TaxID=2617518 RepID=UPI000EC1DFCA|nr:MULTISPECIES: glycosyltransferase family 4 protein [unclassified Micromonospora]MCX4472536.1 glycosyltransferase family 4 protein [Micromonospora sp. NBC_01655]RGC69223.1 GDP-mannose-dependent alpha-(1-6)-phosphatidylinositol monomannoside mannosyltransferase [Micromonospora sp. MW-13]